MTIFLWLLSLVVIGGCGFVFGWSAHAFLVGEAKAVEPVPVFKVAETPPAPPPPMVVAPRVDPPSVVTVKFMDANERKVRGTVQMDSRQRKPTIWADDRKYMAARQDADGAYVYREVAH